MHKNECKFREYEKEYIKYIHKNDMYDNIKEYMITVLRKTEELGSEPFENGINILGAHIDLPRMDIKQNPLYEEGGFAYLDTHY